MTKQELIEALKSEPKGAWMVATEETGYVWERDDLIDQLVGEGPDPDLEDGEGERDDYGYTTVYPIEMSAPLEVQIATLESLLAKDPSALVAGASGTVAEVAWDYLLRIRAKLDAEDPRA